MGETEETFRLQVFDGRTIELPERLLSLLGIVEGDEIGITTDSGSVKSVIGIHREESTLVEEDDVIQRRREVFIRGENDGSEGGAQ